MKPTIEQVVEHFGLPEEALSSFEIEHCINDVTEEELAKNREAGGDDMGYIAWEFSCEWDCPIGQWFKPNYGMDEAAKKAVDEYFKNRAKDIDHLNKHDPGVKDLDEVTRRLIEKMKGPSNAR